MASRAQAQPSGDRLAYGPEEVARLMGLGRTTVFELIAEGKLQSFKVGARRLIPASAVHALLKGQ